MFVLDNGELTTSDYTEAYSQTFLLQPISSSTNYGSVALLEFMDVSPVITSISSNSITVTNVDAVVAIQAGGILYYLAEDPSSPATNTFTITSATTVELQGSVAATTAIVYSGTDTLKTNYTRNVPAILLQLPITSNIALTDNFQDHPDCSLTIVSSINNAVLLRNTFKPGDQVVIEEFGFTVDNYSETILPDTNDINISISLKGKWEDYMSFPIPLKQNAVNAPSSIPYADPDCAINTTTPANTLSISFTALVNRINARYAGFGFVVKIPKNIDSAATTTISNELTDRLDLNSSFIYLGNKDAIQTKKLNEVTTWVIKDDQLVTSFSTSINRKPSKPGSYTTVPNLTPQIDLVSVIPSTITAKPYREYSSEVTSTIPYPTLNNTVLVDDFAFKLNTSPKETTQNLEPKYRLRTPKVVTYTKGDLDAAECPAHIKQIRDLTYNYDNGGITKTIITVTEEDGSPIYETTRRYGFAYLSSDIIVFLTLPGEEEASEYLQSTTPNQWWQLVEEITTYYIYDENTGYLLGYEQSGRRLMRLHIEQSDFESYDYEQSALAQIDDDSTDAQWFNACKFRWVPYFGAKKYLLAQHRDYYRNFQKASEYTIYKKCNADGTSELAYQLDPTYTEPMFVLVESEEKQCFTYQTHPDNTARESGDPYLAPLLTGEETYNRVSINILPSANTNPGFVEDNSLPQEDRYTTFTSSYTSQEPGFGVLTENTSTSESSGVPAVHTKKPAKYELVETTEEPDREQQPTNQYILWTAPSTGNYPYNGTTSFDKALYFTEALAAVTNQLTLEDIRGTLSSSCTIKLNRAIKAGDICVFYVNSFIFKRRVITVTHNYTIDQGFLTGLTELNLGLERTLPAVQYRYEKIPNPNAAPKQNVTITLVKTKGLTMGSIIGVPTRSRGNYDGTEE